MNELTVSSSEGCLLVCLYALKIWNWMIWKVLTLSPSLPLKYNLLLRPH